MSRVAGLVLVLCLGGCGAYLGSEGLYYNGGAFKNFQTDETDLAWKKQIDAAFKAGKAGVTQPTVTVPEPTTTIKILDEDQVEAASGGVLSLVAPYSPLLVLIFGGIVAMFRRKKK